MQIGRGGVRAATFLVVGSFFLLSLDLKFSEILIIAMPLILHDAVRGEGMYKMIPVDGKGAVLFRMQKEWPFVLSVG